MPSVSERFQGQWKGQDLEIEERLQEKMEMGETLTPQALVSILWATALIDQTGLRLDIETLRTYTLCTQAHIFFYMVWYGMVS